MRLGWLWERRQRGGGGRRGTGRPDARRRDAGRWGNDRGVVTAYVAIVATGLIFVAGLVYDGGQMINTYLEASDLAGNAARAGAQATNPTELYRSGTVRLDVDDARDRAEAFLARAGHPGTGSVSVDGDRVTVTVTLQQASHILPLGPRSLQATASATAVRGVEQPAGVPG